MAARRTILVHSTLSTAEMSKRLENAGCSLEKLAGWKISQKDETSLVFKVGMGFQSWGEQVVIKIQESDFWVRSECVIPFQFIDWGKNEENTDLVKKALNKSIESIA